jgi:cobalamin synthase
MATSEKKLSLLLVRFCTAIRFLTIVPLSWRAAEDAQQFNKCLVFFPLVGALIGTVGSAAAYVLLFFFPAAGRCRLGYCLSCLYLGLPPS